MSLNTFREVLQRKMENDLGQEGAQEFMAASSHPFTCKCGVCLNWWVLMGPEDGGSYGPFTKEEVESAKKAQEG